MANWENIKQSILNKLFMTADEANQEGHLKNFIPLANEALILIANSAVPNKQCEMFTVTEPNTEHSMPEDFLSFSDALNYRDNETNPTIYQIGYNKVILPKPGKYAIFYDALYPEITDFSKKLDIPQSIVTCIPFYVVSQLLAQDDIQRATILRNEFERLISVLEPTEITQYGSFTSNSGWY